MRRVKLPSALDQTTDLLSSFKTSCLHPLVFSLMFRSLHSQLEERFIHAEKRWAERVASSHRSSFSRLARLIIPEA